VIDADRAPATAGVKVTEIVQLAPAATLLPQLLVALKSVPLVPVTAMPVRVSVAVPALESVMV
jgi:hypothetical protein